MYMMGMCTCTCTWHVHVQWSMTEMAVSLYLAISSYLAISFYLAIYLATPIHRHAVDPEFMFTYGVINGLAVTMELLRPAVALPL